jgi:flavin-dependent dehydrogenase
MPAHDVIVIGSGPAGCAAAVTCAKAGLKIMVVTDSAGASLHDDPAPSILESIHPGVSSLLHQIGIGGAELAASRAFYSGIYAGNHYSPLGEDNNGPWQGMHIDRKVFDAQLLNQIRYSGIPVRLNEKVENLIVENDRVTGIRTSSTDMQATYIIDASGKKAIGGRKLGFKRKFFSPPLVCWTGISKTDASFPFDQNAAHFLPGENSWTWLAPQPPDHCAWTKLSAKGEKSFLPPEELKGATTIGKIQVANMRWRLYRPVCSEGIVLCGDAAGILDPAAGQGIFNALLSGITAANTVISCLREPDTAAFHLAYYDDWFVRQFETKVQHLRTYYRDHAINII